MSEATDRYTVDRSSLRTAKITAVGIFAGGGALGYGAAKVQEIITGEDMHVLGEVLYAIHGAGFGGIAAAMIAIEQIKSKNRRSS